MVRNSPNEHIGTVCVLNIPFYKNIRNTDCTVFIMYDVQIVWLADITAHAKFIAF